MLIEEPLSTNNGNGILADTDAAVICSFMEPNPCSRTRSRDSENGWWRLIGADRKTAQWKVSSWAFTLDRLHTVEDRLTKEQRYLYWMLLSANCPAEDGFWRLVHATPAQKIKALAAVILETITNGTNEETT